MAKSKSLPQYGVRVPTFAALEQYVRAFAAGHLNLLMIFGHPGAGKSRCVRQALGSQVCWISGQASPFGIYLQAYEHRHQPLVLDDIDGLCADRSGIRLLKALGQTERTKTLTWQTEAPTLERRGIPRQFTTTSRVALVGNAWQTLNADVAALEDRVAKLKANRAYASEAERVQAFIQAGAGCRATYFHHAQKLRSVGGTPKIALTHTTPPADAVPPADHLDRLRRRFGPLGNG